MSGQRNSGGANHSGWQSVLLCPRSWRTCLEFGVEMIGPDALRRFVTAACPEFKAGQIIEVDLPEGGHLQKVIGCGPQNVESLDASEVVIVVFHDVFPFAVGFLEDAETGSRTYKPAGQPPGGTGNPETLSGPPGAATRR